METIYLSHLEPIKVAFIGRVIRVLVSQSYLHLIGCKTIIWNQTILPSLTLASTTEWDCNPHLVWVAGNAPTISMFQT